MALFGYEDGWDDPMGDARKEWERKCTKYEKKVSIVDTGEVCKTKDGKMLKRFLLTVVAENESSVMGMLNKMFPLNLRDKMMELISYAREPNCKAHALSNKLDDFIDDYTIKREG